MTKITKLEVGKSFSGKDPSITVTLDNGVTGYLQKDSDANLKEGEEVLVTTKPYTSKAGKSSTLVTLKRAGTPTQHPTEPQRPIQTTQPQPSQGATTPKSADIFNQKCAYQRTLIEVLFDGFYQGKLDDVKLLEKYREWRVIGEDAIDEVAKG